MVDESPGETRALFAQLYRELRRLAHGAIASGDTLDTTALVHELYLRLADRSDLRFGDARAFHAYAARAMRSLLVDRARQRQRLKRGGAEGTLVLDEQAADAAVQVHIDAALEMDELLRRLAAEHARSAQVLELHYFAGLSGERIADLLGLNRRTVVRDLEFARAWIRAHWSGEPC